MVGRAHGIPATMALPALYATPWLVVILLESACHGALLMRLSGHCIACQVGIKECWENAKDVERVRADSG